MKRRVYQAHGQPLEALVPTYITPLILLYIATLITASRQQLDYVYRVNLVLTTCLTALHSQLVCALHTLTLLLCKTTRCDGTQQNTAGHVQQALHVQLQAAYSACSGQN